MTDEIGRPPGGYDPSGGQTRWQWAISRGVGYFLPSVAFLAIPLGFAWARKSAAEFLLLVVICLVISVLFVGAPLTAHRSLRFRVGWLGGLVASLVAMSAVTGWDTSPVYFLPYLTTAIASVLQWRQSRIVIPIVSLAALGIALIPPIEELAVIMALAGGVLGFSIALGNENEQVKRRLAASERRTAELTVEAERERISRDLHDILGHSLTAIAVKADLAGRLVSRDPAAAEREIADLGSIARRALGDVRSTAIGMREVRLATELASAKAVLEAAGVQCRTPSALPDLDDATSELFGYVVREATTNVVRHAGASLCDIVVDASRVSVADDGVGIGVRRGNGLVGLEKRVEAVGGTLIVQSGSRGTTVRATTGGRS